MTQQQKQDISTYVNKSRTCIGNSFDTEDPIRESKPSHVSHNGWNEASFQRS